MIVDDLVRELRARGHEVDTILIPFNSNPSMMAEQMVGLRLMDVAGAAERLIAIRTPSYMLRHPNKVAWFIHHHRGAYDLWGTPYQDLPRTPEGEALRDTIVAADNESLREMRAIYTNSGVVRDRLHRYNGLPAEVLYPPLTDTQRFRCEPAEDYVFYPSRITDHKRQWLAAEAMQHVNANVRLVIAGAGDSPHVLARLQNAIDAAGVSSRVELIARWISEEEKQDLLARSLGVLYLPFDEDSYGYPSLEAFHSGKPVITCTDSGGTHEIVEDGVTGLIAEPTPTSVAAAIDRLATDRDGAAAMGAAGAERIDELRISWDRVVSALLS